MQLNNSYWAEPSWASIQHCSRQYIHTCVCVCCCVYACMSLCVSVHVWAPALSRWDATQQPAERCSQQVFSSDSDQLTSFSQLQDNNTFSVWSARNIPEFTQPQSCKEKTADLINHLSWSYRPGRLFGWIIDCVIDWSFAQSKQLFPQRGDELDVSAEEFSRWY